MRTRTKATNFELTGAIQDYIDKKMVILEKYLNDDDNEVAILDIEVSRELKGQNSGDVFRAEVMLTIGKDQYRAVEQTGDLYAAIDAAKDALGREVKRDKNKKKTLFQRGARSLKKRLKGLKPWK